MGKETVSAPVPTRAVAPAPANDQAAPDQVACGCGCSIFDVGAQDFDFLSGAPKQSSGLTVWFRYNFSDQNQNFEGSHRALASDNSDKEIRTNFYTLGAQYNLNKDWSIMGELPLFDRTFISTDDGTIAGPAGSLYKAHLDSLGDAKLMGVYHGFSSDLSNGLVFGLKLPTGNSYGPTGALGGAEFDRDSLPGTGSTDFILGGYHFGTITSDKRLGYFLQANYQVAFLTRDNYRPGNELTAAAGLSYSLTTGDHAVHLTPVLQLLGQYRAHDTGLNADYLNSGYTRLYLAPGAEVRIDKFHIYADVEFPLYQNLNSASSPAIEGTAGQLAAPVLFKLQTSYDF